MSEPPRRPSFQFHLSTAILLMFTAGGIMWANTIERTILRSGTDFDTGKQITDEVKYYGWPFAFKTVKPPEKTIYESDGSRRAPSIVCGNEERGFGGHLNVLIHILILITVWYLAERLIPRRLPH